MADNKKSAPQLIYESQESLYQKAVKAMELDRLIVQFAFKRENYLKAAEMFEEVGDYEDAPELAKRCRELAEQTKKDELEYKYQMAVKQKDKAKTAAGYGKAVRIFEETAGYLDSDKLKEECVANKTQLEKKAKMKSRIRTGIVLAIMVAAVAFFTSSKWTALKDNILGEKMEEPRFSQLEVEDERAEI